MVKFTKDAVIAALEEIVKEKGEDYVYPQAEKFLPCVYAVDGEPSCIVGQVIAKIDPDLLKEVAEFEARTESSFGVTSFNRPDDDDRGRSFDTVSNEYIEYPSLDADPEAWNILRIAQSRQDNRQYYGEVVEQAINEVD